MIQRDAINQFQLTGHDFETCIVNGHGVRVARVGIPSP